MPFEISDVIRVSAEVRAGGVARKEFGRTLLLTVDATLSAGGAGKVQAFARMADVAEVFGSTTEPYQAAQIYFQQVPRPKNLLIGRWANVATPTTLTGGAHAALADLQAITDGSFTLGGQEYAGLDLSGVTDLAGVATALQTALRAGPDVRVDAVVVSYANSRFNLSIPDGSDVGGGFGAAASGTALGTPLGLSDALATYRGGSEMEAVQEALTAIEALDDSFYFISIDKQFNGTDTAVDVAEWAAARRYMAFLGSSEGQALMPNDATSQLAEIAGLESPRAIGNWSTAQDYLGLSMAGRLSSVDFALPNSLITAKFKAAPGITPSVITESQKAELDRKRCNYYVRFSGNAIYTEGVTPKPGVWIDVQYFLDWMVNAVEVDVWNLLVSSPSVPQTPTGMQAIREKIVNVLEQGVTNGGIAPGTVSPDFILDIRQSTGNLEFDGVLTNGYLVYHTPLAAQSQTDRDARKSPPFKIWLKGSGAIHNANIALVFEN